MNANGYNLSVDIWSLGCTILEMITSKPPWSQYEGVIFHLLYYFTSECINYDTTNDKITCGFD